MIERGEWEREYFPLVRFLHAALSSMSRYALGLRLNFWNGRRTPNTKN